MLEGSKDPPGGPKEVRGASGWSGRGWRPSGKSGSGRETLGEVREGSGDPWEVREVSEKPRGGPRGVGEPTGRSRRG